MCFKHKITIIHSQKNPSSYLNFQDLGGQVVVQLGDELKLALADVHDALESCLDGVRLLAEGDVLHQDGEAFVGGAVADQDVWAAAGQGVVDDDVIEGPDAGRVDHASLCEIEIEMEFSILGLRKGYIMVFNHFGTLHKYLTLQRQ